MNAVRTLASAMIVASTTLVVGCGESPQTKDRHSAAKHDTAPYTGGSAASFTQSGWKSGDANGWSQQLKARAQYGQNDHQRVVTP